MDLSPSDNKLVCQVKSGIQSKISILKQGWYTWEFGMLVIMIILLAYICSIYALPVMTMDNSYTPTQQEIGDRIDIPEIDGQVELLCNPTRSYISTETTLNCDLRVTEVGSEQLRQFSREEIDGIFEQSPFILNYTWEKVGQQSQREYYYDRGIMNTAVNQEDGYYTIQHMFTLQTPSSPGQYHFYVDRGQRLNLSYPETEFVNVYSQSQAAGFRYRDTVAPLEELVSVGIILAILRFIFELSTRIVKKVEK